MCGSEHTLLHSLTPPSVGSVRCNVRSSDAVLDGRLCGIEPSLAFTFRTFEWTCVAPCCHCFHYPSLSCALFADWSGAHQQPDNEVDRAIPSCGLESAGKSMGFISLVQDMRIDCCIGDSDRERWCPLKTGQQSLHTLIKVCGSGDQTNHQGAVFWEIEEVAGMDDDTLFAN